jgi:hypothetical protein
MLIGRSKSARPKENAPHEAGHYLNLGSPGRNRTRAEDANPNAIEKDCIQTNSLQSDLVGAELSP